MYMLDFHVIASILKWFQKFTLNPLQQSKLYICSISQNPFKSMGGVASVLHPYCRIDFEWRVGTLIFGCESLVLGFQ